MQIDILGKPKTGIMYSIGYSTTFATFRVVYPGNAHRKDLQAKSSFILEDICRCWSYPELDQ